MSEIGEVGII